jgi:O-antigen/teichoic acid export membrane protein
MLSVIYFLADFIIVTIAGEDYLSSSMILKVTMLYTFFIPFSRQFGTLMDSIGKPKINLLITLVTSFLNIAISYAMIKEFGVIGAAYGTLTTYLLNFFFVQAYLYKKFSFSFLQVFREMLLNYNKALRYILKLRSSAN